MTGYKVANLKIMLEELGEERTTGLLSKFSSPLIFSHRWCYTYQW